MSVYGELDPMAKPRAQFFYKKKREHIAEVNLTNSSYPN